jgi:hypothetical protein
MSTTEIGTGLAKFDEILKGGFKPGELTIICGPGSLYSRQGKSLLVERMLKEKSKFVASLVCPDCEQLEPEVGSLEQLVTRRTASQAKPVPSALCMALINRAVGS